MSGERVAVVAGAEGPGGAEIVAKLQGLGFSVACGSGFSGPRTSPQYGFSSLVGRPIEACLDVKHVHVLVVNRPSQRPVLPFLEVSQEAFVDVVTAVATDALLLCRQLVPRMSEGASVVFVGTASHLGADTGVDAACAMAALAGLTRALAQEYRSKGLTVNMIAVGVGPDDPARREGIASAVAALVLSSQRLLTGATLLLDEGASLPIRSGAETGWGSRIQPCNLPGLP